MRALSFSTTTLLVVYAALSSKRNFPHGKQQVGPTKRRPVDMTEDAHIWNGEDEDAFNALAHPGYSLESDPVTHTGGWHVHRAVWESCDDDGEAKSCWIKDDVMSMITRFDYKSMPIGRPPRILVLYGSLRPTSFSRKLAYEFA